MKNIYKTNFLRGIYSSNVYLGWTLTIVLLSIFNSASASHIWSKNCGSGYVEMYGAGIKDLPSAMLSIPGGLDADSIVVEVVSKGFGTGAATTCTFSSAVEGPLALGGTILPPLAGGFNQVRVFRHTMLPTSTVSVSTDFPATTLSVIAYVYKAGGGVNPTSSNGHFASYYLFKGEWSDVFTVAPAAAPRDITIRVPITDLEPDARVAIISASAGGVTTSTTVSVSDLGDYLRIVELVLPNVPAAITEVAVSIASPVHTGALPFGDSFVFGVVVSSSCPTPCAGDFNLDIVGTGTDMAPTTTLSIPDPSTIDHMVIEVVGKGVGFGAPTSCTFSSSVEPAVTLSGTIVPPLAGGFNQVSVFRKTMLPASSVTIATDDPSTTLSVVAYVYRTTDGEYYESTPSEYYLYKGDWTRTFTIPTSISDRDVIVTFPVTDLQPDARIGIFSAEAGGVSASSTVAVSDLGAYLRIVTLTLASVPAGTSEVNVHVSSPLHSGPLPYGDSFVFGVTVEADCAVTACNPPAITSVTFPTPVKVLIDWEDEPGAIAYQICGREIGSTDFVCQTRLVSEKLYYGISSGSSYEVKVRVKCADGSESDFGPLYTIVAPTPRLSEEIDLTNSVRISPNPVVNTLYLDIDASLSGNSRRSIELTDLSGRVISKQRIDNLAIKIELNLSELSSGVYLLKFQEGSQLSTQKIFVQH